MEENKALVQGIVDRMKEVLGKRKDVEIAEHFGGSRSGPAVWKLRGSIPMNECIELAIQYEVSLDWLVLGRGEGPKNIGGDVKEIGEGVVRVPLFDMATYSTEAEPQMWFQIPRAWFEHERLSTVETIAVRSACDTMSPAIVRGQMVIIDRRPTDIDGVFLVSFGGVFRFKRLQRMVGGELRMSNDQSPYSVEIIKGDQIEIIGYCHAALARVF